MNPKKPPKKHQEKAPHLLTSDESRKEHKDKLKLPEERHYRISTHLGQPAVHEQASENRLYFHGNPNCPKSALLRSYSSWQQLQHLCSFGVEQTKKEVGGMDAVLSTS